MKIGDLVVIYSSPDWSHLPLEVIGVYFKKNKNYHYFLCNGSIVSFDEAYWEFQTISKCDENEGR